jgi:hypothetical protein
MSEWPSDPQECGGQGVKAKGSRPAWTLAQKQARSLTFCVRWLRNEDDRWIEWFRVQQRSPPHRVVHHRSKQVGHKGFAQTFGAGIILATAEVINCLAPFTGRRCCSMSSIGPMTDTETGDNNERQARNGGCHGE